MKHLAITLLLIGLIPLGAAVAQDQTPHSFGLYFDEAGDGCFTMNEITVAVGHLIEAHMVISNPNGAVLALEISFADTDPSGLTFWLSSGFNVPAIDIAPEPNVIIAGFADPILPNACGHAWVGTLQLLSVGVEGFEILAGPTVPSSLPDTAAYLDADNQIIPLNFSTNAQGLGVNSSGWLQPGYGLCAVNMNAAVPIEATSWSNLKALYR